MIDVFRITDDIRISVGQRTFQNAFVDEFLKIAEAPPVCSAATQTLIQSREVILRAVSTDFTAGMCRTIAHQNHLAERVEGDRDSYWWL